MQHGFLVGAKSYFELCTRKILRGHHVKNRNIVLQPTRLNLNHSLVKSDLAEHVIVIDL